MVTLSKLYQSETKKYYLKIKDPETGNYIDPTTLQDIQIIVYTDNNNQEVKRMSLLGSGDFIAMSTKVIDGVTVLVLPIEYNIMKEVKVGFLSIQITILSPDTDYDDNTARKSYFAKLNLVKQSLQ